jgi:flavin-dependent dehydrogenase
VRDRVRDAVVIGAGPAGLAFAIAAAARGLDVTVLDRRTPPLDKACGEGLLPAGVRALERLGARAHLAPGEAAPLRALRWIDPAGPIADLRLPEPGGLGVRRTALSAALLARAREVGVEVILGEEVRGHRREEGRIWAETARGGVAAGLLVAADGLASPTRRREGLDGAPARRRRFGIRRHFAVAAWTDAVEVHLADGAEAYVTPLGRGEVGVAFLVESGARAPFDVLLARFPAVAARIAGAAPASALRGAGPFERRVRARTADRLVLLGDAGGYVDALTGEGLSLAFGCAEDLAALAPAALARGATRTALAPYEAAWRRRFFPYAAWTRALLALARHPALRRRVLALAAARPAPFERLVAAAVG